jgi:hypothetical protein
VNTLASAQTPLLPLHEKASIYSSRLNSWNVSATALVQQFGDTNKIVSFSAWTLIPVFKYQTISLSTGYAYSFDNSQKSAYLSKQSASAAAAANDISNLAGAYTYFTPNLQQVHRVLAKMTAQPTPRFKAEINASYGIVASAKIPYLFLDQVNNQFIISREFQSTDFHPYEYSLLFEYKFSAVFKGNVTYKKSSTYFYTSDHISFGFTLNFAHESRP